MLPRADGLAKAVTAVTTESRKQNTNKKGALQRSQVIAHLLYAGSPLRTASQFRSSIVVGVVETAIKQAATGWPIRHWLRLGQARLLGLDHMSAAVNRLMLAGPVQCFSRRGHRCRLTR